MQDQNNVERTIAEYSSFRGRGSLEDMVRELQRQADSACDFVADTRDIQFSVGNDGELLVGPANNNLRDFLPQHGVPLLDQALAQVCLKAPIPGNNGQNAGIPTKFFRNSLKAHPGRTIDFLNGVMHDMGKRRLVRCLDNKVRAFLSDQYRVIDTMAVAKQALKILREVNAQVLEASVTDSRVRIKMIAPEIWSHIEQVRTSTPSSGWYSGGLGNQEYLSKVAAQSRGNLPHLDDQDGDGTVWPIGTIGNSETGHGGLFFRGGILQAICYNAATVENVIREVHLGSRLETGLYKRDTVESEAETIFLKLRDNMQTFFTPAHFHELCAKVRGQTESKIEKPNAAVNLLVGGSDALCDKDSDDILAHFIGDHAENSVYGLGQAVARYAQDTDEADRADDLETLAGEILTGKHNRLLAEALVAS